MSQQTIKTHVLGYPRLGAKRELKWALERYWSGKTTEAELHEALAALRQRHWQMQVDAGLTMVTAGDFAYYDHVLELSESLGVVPKRHEGIADRLGRCFAMARGHDQTPACEMKKWFNTNYHYLVPELEPHQQFSCAAAGAPPPDVVTQCREAAACGLPIKAALTGPLTYLYLAKFDKAGEFSTTKLEFADELAEAYVAIIARLQAIDVQWLQLDEPVLSLDVPAKWLQIFESIYEVILAGARPRIMIANSYGHAGQLVEQVANLAVDGFHVDLYHGGSDLEIATKRFAGRVLSLGAIDGRNVWRANLPALHEHLKPLVDRDGELWVGTSCSLLHVPMDADGEKDIQTAGIPVAFAKQKLNEIAALARTLEGSATAEDQKLFASAPDFPIADPGWIDADWEVADLQLTQRDGPKGWPDIELPTTTIGSLPQTSAIRAARAAWRKGDLSDEQYESKMRAEIKQCVTEQLELGLDILVHGECERNDMVEYFANLLEGVTAPNNGWVQSYGSRATRPPIIYGDILRPAPMTVRWSKYAVSLTKKPMKGMLTGPITVICWSYPRADVPRMRTAFQLAQALQAEVRDLVAAKLPIIQIDEPALREGLPLDPKEHRAYLAQAVAAFNYIVTDCSAQIHTHMCYGEFSNIAEAIVAMDADVISLETSRTDMSVLGALAERDYPAGVGPGIYDVHSPRVPSVDEMESLLKRAMEWVPKERLWVNPDCGLKTRRWEETREALYNMVIAAGKLRSGTKPPKPLST